MLVVTLPSIEITELVKFSKASVLALVVICSSKALESERASLAIWSVTVKSLFNLVIESLWEVIAFSEELTLLVRELKALEST